MGEEALEAPGPAHEPLGVSRQRAGDTVGQSCCRPGPGTPCGGTRPCPPLLLGIRSAVAAAGRPPARTCSACEREAASAPAVGPAGLDTGHRAAQSGAVGSPRLSGEIRLLSFSYFNHMAAQKSHGSPKCMAQSPKEADKPREHAQRKEAHGRRRGRGHRARLHPVSDPGAPTRLRVVPGSPDLCWAKGGHVGASSPLRPPIPP